MSHSILRVARVKITSYSIHYTNGTERGSRKISTNIGPIQPLIGVVVSPMEHKFCFCYVRFFKL